MIKYGDLSSVYFPMLSDEYFVDYNESGKY
jgi:hypothetical protein